ncbi:MAG: right-handed parallel beta-helix repeat-containing protein [Candidatus Bathyarchaeia archaeon]
MLLGSSLLYVGCSEKAKSQINLGFWTIYIRANGSIEPPDAPISTEDNITYILRGDIINASIVIERSNIVLDGNNHVIQGPIKPYVNPFQQFYEPLLGINISASSVTIKNIVVKNFMVGIYVIRFSNNMILNNTLVDNYWAGIAIVAGSIDNKILNNTFINDGLLVSDSYNNTVAGNSVNGKPLVYLGDAANLTVDNAGQVILVRCNGIRVENLNIESVGVAIELERTNNTVIARNIIINGRIAGIWISCYITLTEL